MLKEKIQPGPRQLTVAVDCGNGTASLFAERILESWGCRVIPLYCSSEGTFPHHHPDPVKTANLADLRKAVAAGLENPGKVVLEVIEVQLKRIPGGRRHRALRG